MTGRVNYRGRHFDIEQAKLWDLPDERVPIGIAVSGEDSKVNADLPNPESFYGASQFVTPEDVAEAISCGPDVEEHVNAIKPFVDAGFTEVAVVQIGAEQQDEFIGWAESELLPALRSL